MHDHVIAKGRIRHYMYTLVLGSKIEVEVLASEK